MADPESERSHLAFQSYYQGQARRHFGRVRSCIRAQTLPWLVHAQTHHGWEDSEISKDPGRKSWYGFWGSAQDAKNAEQKWTGDYLLQFDVSSFKFIYLCYALLWHDYQLCYPIFRHSLRHNPEHHKQVQQMKKEMEKQ